MKVDFMSCPIKKIVSDATGAWCLTMLLRAARQWIKLPAVTNFSKLQFEFEFNYKESLN